MRKQPVGFLDPWDDSFEVGDRAVDNNNRVFDLLESRGRNKRAQGDLTPVLASPQRNGSYAVYDEGVWFWERKLSD